MLLWLVHIDGETNMYKERVDQHGLTLRPYADRKYAPIQPGQTRHRYDDRVWTGRPVTAMFRHWRFQYRGFN